jgi:hypothetical protein
VRDPLIADQLSMLLRAVGTNCSNLESKPHPLSFDHREIAALPALPAMHDLVNRAHDDASPQLLTGDRCEPCCPLTLT